MIDAAMAAAVREVRDAIPGSELALLPGERHSAMLSAPELFVSMVRAFLDARHALSPG